MSQGESGDEMGNHGVAVVWAPKPYEFILENVSR